MGDSDFPSEWPGGSTLTPSAAEWNPSSNAATTTKRSLTPSAVEFTPQQQHTQNISQSHIPVARSDGSVTYLSAQEAASLQQQKYIGEAHSHVDITQAPLLKARGCKPVPPRRTYANSTLLPDDLRGYLAAQTELLLKEIEGDNALINEVPREFNMVNPLDDPTKRRGAAGSCGYPTSVYKVVNTNDGHVYCLRRVDNVRSRGLQDTCTHVIQLFSRVQHANVVPLRDAFIRRGALFLVHDYFPGAKTLSEFVTARGNGNLLPESSVWAMIIQLLTAIRAIHSQGIACRGLTPSRVIITGRQRVRIAGCGLSHILENDSSIPIAAQMHEDLTNVGRLVLVLATMSVHGYQSIQNSVDVVRNRFSQELAQFTTLFFQRSCNLQNLFAMASQKLVNHMDELYSHSDALEEHLCKQMESERLSRILIKLGLVNERPEYGDAWSETGDRYILKLFRDYVFHQTDDNGKPFLDIGHIIDCLNKVDIGSTEKILLTSRDERSMLVVTFEDVRRCLEETFTQLLPAQYLQHAHMRHHAHNMMYGHGYPSR
eukprot:CAMPEP_0204836482 /NCGR_PEP_ID=MMETSP1346-20131115/25263_1 /ASSEMBLY_ACC=CAM_ASM_000771 /TAXON_ID=215587 /ORGANISM="Aplanochytrium stocchinoi, Strain GSBS06" /LENGTH=542 /DNA_ID=CAMNT_0051971229 /DNA_START=75 /DNA_END=1703 /DNA_ORIENTATION=-